MHKVVFTVVLLLGLSTGYSQICTTLGQNPSTAFPVCGTSTFIQNNVPICGNKLVPVPCQNTTLFTDKNPFWYKFKCYTAGTLGFIITPNNVADDYDWQLFDITGKNPDDVYTDPTLFVACSWSGDGGLTGASNAGTVLISCDGPGQPLFTRCPQLILDHDYILLVSHFSDSQLGYKLSFGGGTASITDSIPPHMAQVRTNCAGSNIGIKLNKKMKCSSLMSNGTEFSISPPLATVFSASGNTCGSGFNLDSLTLTLSNALPAGVYTLTINLGMDGNTIVDNCDAGIPDLESLPFTVLPLIPTPLDSIVPVKCTPSVLRLIFSKKILCSSIAADGSDFIITGPSAVSIQSANVFCSGGNASEIDLLLTTPILKGGTYSVQVVAGSDGNTLINECAQATPIGSNVSLITKDTVNASYNYSGKYGCRLDTIFVSHIPNNGVDQWTWSLNGRTAGTASTSVLVLPAVSKDTIQLIVSNGICSDTVTSIIDLNNGIDPAFALPDTICPEDPVTVTNTSTGTIDSWLWNFGDGTTSTLKSPGPKLFPPTGIVTDYQVTLTASNILGCVVSISEKIYVLKSCFIAVPTAFTPNGDFLNDYLYPLNAFKADDLDFKVYNRWGILMFHSTFWNQMWDGRYKGQPQDSGVYIWMLRYTHHDTGKQFNLKGTTVLIR